MSLVVDCPTDLGYPEFLGVGFHSGSGSEESPGAGHKHCPYCEKKVKWDFRLAVVRTAAGVAATVTAIAYALSR